MKNETDGDAGLKALSAERLAGLSDGMFGVAMTLLVTKKILPARALTAAVPAVFHDFGRALSPAVLSFAISGIYWLAQQRQLSLTRSVTPTQTLLNFNFLFLVVLLPVTTNLSEGTHLALLSLVNLLLWIEVRAAAPRGRIVGSSLTLASFLAASAIGLVRPESAQYFRYAGFILPWVGRRVTQRISKKG